MNNNLKNYYLHQFGLTKWILRDQHKLEPVSWIIFTKSLDTTIFSKNLLNNIISGLQIKDFIILQDIEKLKSMTCKIIISLGELESQQLLNNKQPIDSLRQVTHEYNGVPVVVSFNLDELLINPIKKQKAYYDWCFAQQHVQE